MGLIMSNYKKTKINDHPLYPQLKSGGELFSIKSIDESGIFELNNKKYSKSYVLSDINFAGLTDYEQKMIIVSFSKILDAMSCRFSYTIANENSEEYSVLKDILYEQENDEYDYLRTAVNEMIEDKIMTSKQGLYQMIYLTLTMDADSMDTSIVNFASMEAGLRNMFIQLGTGVRMHALDINQRMQIFYNFTHLGINTDYKFDYRKELFFARDWAATISPADLVIYNDHFELNGKPGAVLFFSEYSKTLDSDVIPKLMDQINCVSYFTVSSELLPKNDLKKELFSKKFKVENKIDDQKKENRKKNDYLSDASESLKAKKELFDDFEKKINDDDSHYVNSTITYMFIADDYEEFNKIRAQIDATLTFYSDKTEACFMRQREGINTTFMTGIQEYKRVCNFSTPCLSMFIPFKTQELKDKDGTYLGINQLSQNVICGNRKNLANRAGMYLGMSRHGKSVFAKTEMINARIKYVEDQILIIDPQGEYSDTVKSMHGTELFFSPQREVYCNPLDVNFKGVGYSELQIIIREKTDFILNLLSSCMNRDITSKEKGIIDAVTKKVFTENYTLRKKLNGEDKNKTDFKVPEYLKKEQENIINIAKLSNDEQIRRYSPILQDIYQNMKDDTDNDTAQELSQHMEIFVNGSLNLFNHRTNIDLNNKTISFNLNNIQENLRKTCMLVMLEIIRSKTTENSKTGNWTWIYIDEFHELLGNNQVADFVIKLWKEIGKLKGILTGITQNMTDLLTHSENTEKLQAIISNTLYFAVFNQSTTDRKKLMEFLPNISPAMFNYVEGADPGTGLLIYGNITIPFDFKIKKGLNIYRLINTDGNAVSA